MLTVVLPVYHTETLTLPVEADAIELRLDYCERLTVPAIIALRSKISVPVIFTLRKVSQGGLYIGSETDRINTLLELSQAAPDYIDIEHDVDPAFIRQLHHQYPHIKLICSYHNFEHTPDDLMSILQSMQQSYFAAYKIATLANNSLDALRMLGFIKQYANQYSLIGICMGEYGQCTRILSKVVGNYLHYASLDDVKAAPGQLSVQELNDIYHFQAHNSHTKIYALLGDPVNLSVGHILHNQAIRFLKENAVYLKLQIHAAELPQALADCKALNVMGMSITMPFKEKIVPLLTHIEAMKAVNSVVKENEQYIGFNTDGVAAIAALRQNIAQQRVVILGAGGAARAIAYAAKAAHARVIIVNRTLSKAQTLAAELAAEYASFDALKQLDYTIIINTLPGDLAATLDIAFKASTRVLDIVYQPYNTAFLQLAKKAGCGCIYGYEMYIKQALLQIERWFTPKQVQLNYIEQMMRMYFD